MLHCMREGGGHSVHSGENQDILWQKPLTKVWFRLPLSALALLIGGGVGLGMVVPESEIEN